MFGGGRAAVARGSLAVLLIAVFGCEARTDTRRGESINNLKQIGLAIHNYCSSEQRLPPAAIDDKDEETQLLSWRVVILPYLENKPLFDQFKQLDESWDGPTNRPLADHTPKVYLAPGDSNPDLGRTNVVAVVGPDTLIASEGTVTLADCTDGLSNTVMAIEVAEFGPRWSEPSDITIDEFVAAVARPPSAMALRPVYAGGILCIFGDGSVRAIPSDTDPAVLRALCTRAGGEKVPVLP